jgi:hypothetical protein
MRRKTGPGVRVRNFQHERLILALVVAGFLLAAWVVAAAARSQSTALQAAALPTTGLQATTLHTHALETATRLDPPAGPRLESAPREAPPLDGDASPRMCAACRLADATTGRIALEDLHIRTAPLADGVSVRATANAPEARELLWKAMVARGELIEALRNGAARDLCGTCRMRSSMLRSLRIEVRRIPDGVELVYTSTSADIVREIHAAARATQPFVTQF